MPALTLVADTAGCRHRERTKLRGSPWNRRHRLTTAATALDRRRRLRQPSYGCRMSINTLISSGDEEYVVVVSVPAGNHALPLTVSFERRDGYCRVDDQNGQDEGSFTSPNNQRIIRTLDDHRHRPWAPDREDDRERGGYEGTLAAVPPARSLMDEGSGGNFEIVLTSKGRMLLLIPVIVEGTDPQ